MSRKPLSPLNLAWEYDKEAFNAALAAYKQATADQEQAKAAEKEAATRRAEAVDAMRRSTATWEQIIQATGLSRQRLWQLGGKL